MVIKKRVEQCLRDICVVVRDVLREAFSVYPFRIIGKQQDSLTKKAIFTLKAKKVLVPIKLATGDIFNNEKYLLGLSYCDRESIIKQYRLELSSPGACIQEIPLTANEKNQFIFKILLVDESRIMVGSASYFLIENPEVMKKLSCRDVIKITMAYCEEIA